MHAKNPLQAIFLSADTHALNLPHADAQQRQNVHYGNLTAPILGWHVFCLTKLSPSNLFINLFFLETAPLIK